MTDVMLSGAFHTSELPKLASEPVTVTVSRTVLPGREQAFETWAQAVARRIETFPGALGAGVFRPGAVGGDYQIVFRFEDALSLRLWERSPQRARLLAEADSIVSETRVQRTVGVEQFFDLADRAEPARSWWKRIVADVLWVYPVALAAGVLMTPLLNPLPMEARTLLSALTITVVMRMAVGPFRKHLRSRRSFG
jgi:uncharacterized protein